MKAALIAPVLTAVFCACPVVAGALRRGRGPPHASLRPQRYLLDDMFQGPDFFTEWDFFAEDDPTHGLVNYLPLEDALGRLAYIDVNGATVLAVDDTTSVPVGGKRDSVRISSKKTYSGGLFIADFEAMPYGCSVWPAYWSVGPDWPAGGEIDVVEGVNTQTANQYTLHTSSGCTLSSPSPVTGTPGNKQCATLFGDNTGCGYTDSHANSYGRAFNAVGGGVFAHVWDDSGIRAWHFARGDVPFDVTAHLPDPSRWGPPAAFWGSATCDMATHFKDHVLVLDTTLCGDWAGSVYPTSGCPGTCADWVADPSHFHDAKWKINYIAAYRPLVGFSASISNLTFV